MKNLTLKSDDLLNSGILTVVCCDLLIEMSAFIGICKGEIDSDNLAKYCAIAVDGKTSGSIRRNKFANNIIGIALKGESEITIISNIFESNALYGIFYIGSATGIAEENLCRGNEFVGILVGENAAPKLLRNSCEENTSVGIGYTGSASGTAEGNNCNENRIGIVVDKKSSPVLLHNICENNRVSGICYGVLFSIFNSAESNIDTTEKFCQLLDSGKALSLSYQTPSGTAEENICKKNGYSGIIVGRNANPSLLRNSLEGNNKFGIYYQEKITGVTEGNVYQDNGSQEIVIADRENEIENT